MDRILIIMKKKWPQGFICRFTGAIFYNIQTCLLVYTDERLQAHWSSGNKNYVEEDTLSTELPRHGLDLLIAWRQCVICTYSITIKYYFYSNSFLYLSLLDSWHLKAYAGSIPDQTFAQYLFIK